MRAVAFVITAGLLLAPQASFGQSSDPAWLDDLKEQIAFDKQCEIAYLLNVREGVLGGQPTYEARVQCADGRMFDASRVGSTGYFEFKACEIQAC
ncbi:MAG: hypothetical protein BroJett030_15270 [Alphaproteobacteria bacterium]|nr:MAG: hypothetical protein BroJett030_15270 [Alphaproteobacteria bacterium]